MKDLCSLATLVLLSIVPLFGQDTNPPERAKSHVGQLVTEGGRLLAEGNINAALEEFRQAHSVAPDDVEAIIGLARAESQHMDDSGKADMQTQALADYQTAVARQPTAELYTELGILFDNRQDYAAAIKAYRKALDLNPQFFSAELNYGNALAKVGDFDNAISVYSRACADSGSVHPGTTTGCGSVKILYYRGWAYFHKGDCLSLSLAEKDFSEGVSIEPGRADLHDMLGNVFIGEGMENLSNCAHSEQERTAYLERAWSELRIALNLDSSNVMTREAFVVVSQVLKRKPEYNGGIAKELDKAELSQLLADHPQLVSSTKSLDSLGSLESLTEKGLDTELNQALAAEQDSVAAAKKAIQAQPTDGFAWGKLGHAYFQLGDYKNAEEATKKAVEIFTERLKNAPNPIFNGGYDEGQTDISMLGANWVQLADICDKLHKRREARRYRDSAVRAFDLLRGQPYTAPQPRLALPQESPRSSGPVSMVCSIPLCPIPQYELCDATRGTNQFLNCLTRNRQEDARYTQCQDQRRRQCSP